jgi:hypothetical protein
MEATLNQSQKITKRAISRKMTNVGQVFQRMLIDNSFKLQTLHRLLKEAVNEFRVHGKSECATIDDFFRWNIIARANGKTAFQQPTSIDLNCLFVGERLKAASTSGYAKSTRIIASLLRKILNGAGRDAFKNSAAMRVVTKNRGPLRDIASM